MRAQHAANRVQHNIAMPAITFLHPDPAKPKAASVTFTKSVKYDRDVSATRAFGASGL
jgi:hypothetical protein